MAPGTARRVASSGLPPGLLASARIIGASLAYLAVLDTVAIVVYALGQAVVPEAARGSVGLLGLGLAEAAAIVSVILVWRAIDKRGIDELGLERAGSGPRWLRGAAVASVMMGFVVFVGYTLVDGATWDVNTDGSRAAVVVLAGLVGFLIQGPAEELLFRGYILENVCDQWGARWAVVVSSVLFSAFHALNPGFGPLPFVNLVLFGVATALYKLNIDGDQLWGVFAIHTVWNWLQQVVFGLPNSGIAAGAQDALFSITPNTSLPAALWGGGFGPEGTVAATLVLAALIVYAARAPRRMAQPPPRR